MTKTISNKKKIFFTISIKQHTKDFAFSFIIFSIMLIIILNPSYFSSGTLNGLKLFFYSVFPGLFPFMFLTKLLTEIGFIFKISKKFDKLSHTLFSTKGISLYALLMSILSGYPIGSQIIGDLYSKNMITENDAKKMSVFCTTSGPIFVIGAVGVGMLHSFKIGLIIYISHILSSIILGIISKFVFSSKQEPPTSQIQYKTPNSNIISNCLTQTTNSILLVGAYITIFYLISELLTMLNIFNVLTNLLFPISSKIGLTKLQLNGCLFGIVEITRGCKELSSFISPTTISLISGLISFSGISIIMQSMSFLKNTKIKTRNFIFNKVAHSIISILICQIILIFVTI